MVGFVKVRELDLNLDKTHSNVSGSQRARFDNPAMVLFFILLTVLIYARFQAPDYMLMGHLRRHQIRDKKKMRKK